MEEKIKGTDKKRTKRMPSAFTILMVLVTIMALLTWVVPAGRYQTDPDNDNAPIAGTYQTAEQAVKETTAKVEEIKIRDGITDVKSDEAKDNAELQEALKAQADAEALTNKQGLWNVFTAPINGFKDGIEIILFVLVIGGFLAIEARTKSLQTAFASLIRKLKGREIMIIPIMMLVFAAGGTIYGMQEETVAFYPLIVPLLLAAGYNAMTAIMVIVGGSTIGLIGGTINPFATGIAAGFADSSIIDGVIPRLILLAVCYIIGVVFVVNYAKGVKAGKYAEDSVNDKKLQYGEIDPSLTKNMTGRQVATVLVYILAFVFLILSVIPWEYKFNITFFADITNAITSVGPLRALLGNIPAFGDWWFIETAALFLIGAIIIGLINKIDQHTFIDYFIEGCKDILAVALIIGVARGITVIMNASHIDATIIHWGEEALRGTSGAFFAVLSYILYIPMSFLIPSTSGLATATMPILAPLSGFVGLGKDVIVTSFTAASGLVQMMAPTVGSLMGGLVICGLSYGKYLKRTWKLMLSLAVASITVLVIISLF
ncbi:MAG: YfcC family protein [Candidatus Saccharibacteria bacterium]|nr:YfcC family protein [Candidatus Saccharibacteria bacterium]